jgi:hypothetical protein
MQHSPITMNSMGNATGFMNSVQPFLISPDIPNMVSLRSATLMVKMLIPSQIPDDFAMWDMEFWNPLLQNGS